MHDNLPDDFKEEDERDHEALERKADERANEDTYEKDTI